MRLASDTAFTARPASLAVVRSGPADARHEPVKQTPPARAATRDPFANPFRIWTDLATIAGEMMLASAQVIGHRTGRMAWTGTAPSARDLDEFNLMSQEKFEAAAESSQAMSAQMAKMNQQMWTQSVRRMQDGMLAMASLAGSRDLGESIVRQAKLVRVMTGATDAGSQLSSAAARLARSGLRPIHARATANAERLGTPPAPKSARRA